MGGIEDSEPPSKRLKGPLGKSKEDILHTPFTSSYSRDLMARPLFFTGDGETVGQKGIVKKQEFVKIITKALYSLGYKKSANLLEEESGIQLDSSAVNLFRQQVLDGKWDEGLATLHNIGISDEDVFKSASFLILEEKFLDLLKDGKFMAALDILRNEIVPLRIKSDRVHELSSYIIYPSQFLALGLSVKDNTEAISRTICLEKLHKLLPAAVMIPEGRLEHLVEQALDIQRDACVFHNTLDSELSLYSDHKCGKNQIPSQTFQILREHKDEVWFLQFSHKGGYLASSSKDQSAIIWEVKDNGQVILKHTLSGHQRPVSTISWSSDDSQLLTCGMEEAIRRWDVNSGECLHVYQKAGVGLKSCGWLADGEGMVSGMTGKSICLWDLDGKELEGWKWERSVNISDMAITDDGKRIISICGENTILLLDRDPKCERLIEEKEPITSFSLSKDNKFLLVNLVDQKLHLWSIAGDLKIVSKFKGHRRTRFLIRSCFGGLEQTFVASGSEDSQVYIWHRSSGSVVATLPGHSGTVNCVSWHPTNPHMLASGSDDRTIRIWGLDELKGERTDHPNGNIIPSHHHHNHHSNGRS